MENKSLQTIKILRWVARILSVIIIAFFLFMFIGEMLDSLHSGKNGSLSNNAILQLTLFGIGIIGIIAAWIWELYGGLLSLVAFVVLAIINPVTIISPVIIYPVNAILFMIVWWMKFRDRKEVN